MDKFIKNIIFFAKKVINIKFYTKIPQNVDKLTLIIKKHSNNGGKR